MRREPHAPAALCDLRAADGQLQRRVNACPRLPKWEVPDPPFVKNRVPAKLPPGTTKPEVPLADSTNTHRKVKIAAPLNILKQEA